MNLPLRKVGEYRETAAALRGATMGAAAQRFSALKIASRRWRPSSLKTWNLVWANFTAIISADRLVSDVTPEDCERVWLTLCSEGKSPQWIEQVRVQISQFFRWLVRHQVVGFSPMTIWEPTTIGEDDHRRVYHDFTPEEIGRLTATEKNPSIWKAIWTLPYTGLRRANLCGMKWGWIDEGWILEIPADQFKQGRRHRMPLHPALHHLLEPRGGPEDVVFPGLPTPGKFTSHMKILARRAGLPEAWAYPHNFRRTFFAWLHRAGVSRQRAMDLAGSRAEDVLIRHYWPRAEDSELWGTISQI